MRTEVPESYITEAIAPSDFMKEIGEAQFKVYGGGDDKYDEALVKERHSSSVN